MEYARLDDHRIAYWTAGSGAPVVFVPGSFATSSAWKRLAANLDASAWRTIALDLPGWGESDPPPAEHPALVEYDAQAVEAVARQNADGPVHLAGHSHGGTVALAVALAGRLRLLSLTLFEPLPVSILASTGDDGVLNELFQFVSDYRRAFESGDPSAARSVIDLWGGRGAFEAMSPAVRAAIAAGTAQNLRHWQGNFAFRPSLEELRNLRVPTTLVQGSSANRIAKLIVQRLHELIPGSTVTELNGTGHFMIHTHAAESARLVGLAAAGGTFHA